MPEPIEPEILPPLNRRPAPGNISNEQLDQLASLLDDIFNVPGTKIRFGLDPLIGLIPGLGDLITGAMSFLIMYGAWQRGLPRVTLARMLANIGIDTVIGILPVFGDVFDVMWKSNRMNYNLLKRADAGMRKSHSLQDWLFLLLLALGMLILISLPFVVLLLVVRIIRG